MKKRDNSAEEQNSDRLENNYTTGVANSNGFFHLPVLLAEVLQTLKPQADGLYIDGTLGGGGHAKAILQTGAHLVGIDRDTEAIAACRERLSEFGERATIVQGNFSTMKAIAKELGVVGKADGILLDLGVSSHQLDVAERGFSYMQEAHLDMRMNRNDGPTAAEIVNTYSVAELTEILYSYGEENWAKRIAEFIVARRAISLIETTAELVEVIKNAIPAGAREKDQHPAKRTFQALRIKVNDELGALQKVIADAIEVLKPEGRLAIITFHSLEDRIVKDRFRFLSLDCVCPPEFPVCCCNKVASVRILTRKPIAPGADEVAANPRSRSSKLRVAEKLPS